LPSGDFPAIALGSILGIYGQTFKAHYFESVGGRTGAGSQFVVKDHPVIKDGLFKMKILDTRDLFG
jgi:hypothetical protein